MNSWRFSVNRIDRSNVAIPVTGEVGAMVIRSPLGPIVPTLIQVGDEARILRLFGTPSVTYPDIFEAVQFNKQAAIYISAPYMTTDRYGGILVTNLGAQTLGIGNGLTDSQIASYTFPSPNDYFLVLPLAPCVDYLAVTVSVNLQTQVFTMNLYQSPDGGVTYNFVNTYVFSMTLGTKDGFGKSMYVTDIFSGNDYIQVLPNLSANVNPTSSFVQSIQINFSGGIRNTSALTITQFSLGWAYFQQARKYAADIFMDTTADPGMPSVFENLSDAYQQYSSYILPFPMGTSASSAPLLKTSYSINDPNFAWYWNRLKVIDIYHNSSFWTSGIGLVGFKYAQMVDVFNGLPPAYIDENKHGGQLSQGLVLDIEYDPSETDLKNLDAAGINPITFDNTNGAMIQGDKSGQTPTLISDYSYIPHVRLFNYIIQNILSQVFTFQAFKLNDTSHRNLVRTKTQAITNPILSVNLLSGAKVVCDTTNNTSAVLAARQFILSVAVQVTPFS